MCLMSRSKRNKIRLREISGRERTCVDLVSDRLGPYIRLLRLNGVNTYTRFCSEVRWSGTLGGDDYFDAPCTLDAFISEDGSIFISAGLYDGYGTEARPNGMLLSCIDVPFTYFERQLIVTKTVDIGMSILINVK